MEFDLEELCENTSNINICKYQPNEGKENASHVAIVGDDCTVCKPISLYCIVLFHHFSVKKKSKSLFPC